MSSSGPTTRITRRAARICRRSMAWQQATAIGATIAPTRCRSEPLVGADGSVVGTLGISRDVTDAVKRERSQATLLRQLGFAQSVSWYGQLESIW